MVKGVAEAVSIELLPFDSFCPIPPAIFWFSKNTPRIERGCLVANTPHLEVWVTEQVSFCRLVQTVREQWKLISNHHDAAGFEPNLSVNIRILSLAPWDQSKPSKLRSSVGSTVHDFATG